jgi:hypothetical protein
MSAPRIGIVAVSLLAVACAADGAGNAEYAERGTLVLAPNSVHEPDLLEGELPTELHAANALLEAGREFDLDTMRALYDFGIVHTDDARPWLLLGYDAANLENWGFATRYYRRAIGADPRAAYQRTVFDELLGVVRSYVGVEQEEASDLIVASYGDEVIGDIDAELADALVAGDTDGAERLRALRVRVQSADDHPVTSGAGEFLP